MTVRLPEPEQPGKEDLSFLAAANILLRHPRLVLVYPLALCVCVVALTYMIRPRYRASVAFAPERRSSSPLPAALSGLAGQFGINLPTDVTQSPAFYVTVLESRGLTEQVLLSMFVDPRTRRAHQDSVPLIALIGATGHTRPESVAVGVRRLGNAVITSVDPRSGVIRLSVETDDPELSAAVATRFVELLNRFNATQRQSQARERRKFIESRIADVERNLRESEESLKRFYERNRSWQQSPKLVVDEGRLRRQIDVVREVYLTLEREYELSRIEEVNDTPVLTVVDPAVPPVKKSKPQRAKIGISLLVVAMLFGGLAAFVADYLERVGAQEPEQLAQLKVLFRDWAHLLRRSRR